jgi:membrane protease YdiL (CAAX protease family)
MDVFQQLGLMLVAWGILAVPVALGCAVLWFDMRRSGRTLLPPQMHVAAPWTGKEVFFIFVLQLLWPSLVSLIFDNILGEPQSEDRPMRNIEIVTLTTPLFLFASWLLLRLTCDMRLYQLGLSRGQWRQNLLLGSLAWLICSPWIFVVNWLVGLVLESLQQAPREHQLSRMMQGREPVVEWSLLLWNAVLIAPLAEECLFRGVTQKWASQLARRSHVLWLITLPLALLGNSAQLHFAAQAVGFWFVLTAGYLLWPALLRGRVVRPKRTAEATDLSASRAPIAASTSILRRVVELVRRDLAQSLDDRLERPPFVAVSRAEVADNTVSDASPACDQPQAPANTSSADQAADAARAIYAVAFLFAIVHPWPTPIPLFLLGLTLGWLAYRTQSLIGPIVFHLLFNAVSCVALAIGIPHP